MSSASHHSKSGKNRGMKSANGSQEKDDVVGGVLVEATTPNPTKRRMEKAFDPNSIKVHELISAHMRTVTLKVIIHIESHEIANRPSS